MRPGRLVVLWDVSGSMAETIPMYLPWLHRVAVSARDVGIFPFGVRLMDLTDAMRQPYASVLSTISATSDLWEGGTELGAAIEQWTARHGLRWLRGRVTVLIISDGWDSGSPESVANALRTIRSRDARIVWMHPLLRTPGFELKTRALVAAKPYVDQWLPGGTPRDLDQMVIS